MTAKRMITFALALVLAFVASTSAQETPDSAKQQAMAEMAKLARPGPEHKILEKMAGNWVTEVKYWMTPGDDNAMVTAGVAENTMTMGGRFLQSRFTAGEGVMKTDGFAVSGFDRRHKKFTHWGIDTWSTYSVSAAGEMSDDSTKIIMYGEDVDPIMNMTQTYYFVYTFINENTMMFEVIFTNPEMTGGAEEHKMVEVTYKRKE
jgi:hypothetical protein